MQKTKRERGDDMSGAERKTLSEEEKEYRVQMDAAIFAFRRYEDSSLRYTGIDSHPDLRRYGLYDTVVAVDSASAAQV